MPGLVEQPPPYVIAAKEGRFAEDQLPAGVGGVVVFRDPPTDERSRK
jgi:hypothetical protein